MNVEQYKELILTIVQGFKNPQSVDEIMKQMKIPESEKEKIIEAVNQLRIDGKIFFVDA